MPVMIEIDIQFLYGIKLVVYQIETNFAQVGKVITIIYSQLVPAASSAYMTVTAAKSSPLCTEKKNSQNKK